MKTTNPGESETRTAAPARPFGVGTAGRPSASAPLASAPSTASALELAVREAGRARARVLDSMTNAELIEILAAAAAAWTQPGYPARVRLLPLLARDLAMPKALLERGLDAIFGAVTRDSLHRLVADEAEIPEALEHPVDLPGRRSARLLGPRVVFHSLAGNVPGLAIAPIISALLARSICIIRDSERQPWLTAAFVATLADFSRDLATMVIPASWRAGDMGMERLVFELAHRVELSGSDATMRSIVSRHPRRPIVTRGTRVSIGVIPRESDTDRWQEGLATDIVLYEGLGCLTPHVIFVEGDDRRARRLARVLGIQLSRYEALYPRMPRDLPAETRRRAFLDGCEMSMLREGAGQLLRGRGDSWVIHYRPTAPAAPGPGLRCIVIALVASRAELVDRLRHATVPLAGVALGLEADHPAYEDIANTLAGLGATWICEPGRLQEPPIDWAQDGQRRLADLLEWRGVEEGA